MSAPSNKLPDKWLILAIPLLWLAALASAAGAIYSKIRAGEAELAANPRARSSVLRVARKVR